MSGPTDATRFQPYAVPSRTGPHVTMQAGIVQAGRFWTTTAATSLKARSVRAHGDACAMVADADERRIVAGRTVALRPFRPWRALEDPVAGSLWALAVLRMGRSNIDQILGYLEAAGSIPTEWSPTRRVLLVTRIDRSITLRGDEVVDSHGVWRRDEISSSGSAATSRPSGSLPVERLPDTHRPVVAIDGRVHLGVATPTGPVALPARWCGDDRFSISAAALDAVDADPSGRASAVFDHSASRRPDEKLGVMFRGQLFLDHVEGGKAVVGLDTERITTWDGFSAETVDARATAPT